MLIIHESVRGGERGGVKLLFISEFPCVVKLYKASASINYTLGTLSMITVFYYYLLFTMFYFLLTITMFYSKHLKIILKHFCLLCSFSLHTPKPHN